MKTDLPRKADQTALHLCRLVEIEDPHLKEAFKAAIQRAMSDAVVSAKRDLKQKLIDSIHASEELLSMVDEAIPTFGSNDEEFFSSVLNSK